jgi:hypothetical protein
MDLQGLPIVKKGVLVVLLDQNQNRSPYQTTPGILPMTFFQAKSTLNG